MSYSSKKAPRRDSVPDLTNAKADLQQDARPSGKQSDQEECVGKGTRAVTPSAGGPGKHYRDVDREIGTRVQIAQNLKGTGTLKDPLGSYRVRVFPPVQNPDGVKNRSGVNKAPGRRSPTTAPIA